MMEIHRVLKPGGQCIIADWGKPKNRVIRWAFYLVQVLDGFATTASNVKGLLPAMLIDNDFVAIKELYRIPTVLGSISIITSKKP